MKNINLFHIEYLKPNETLEFYTVGNWNFVVNNRMRMKWSVYYTLIDFLQNSTPLKEFDSENALEDYLKTV